MKIAIFSDTFPPQVNGVAHVVAQSAMSLAELGHDVRVFTVTKCPLTHINALTGGKYKVYNLPSIPFWGYPDLRFNISVTKAIRIISRWKPDVIHTHTPFGIGWEAAWCAKRFSIPMIGTHHTFYDHYLKHIHLEYRWAKRFSWKFMVNYYNRCDLLISPSQSLAEELMNNGIRKTIKILPNPVDTNIFCPLPNDTAKAKLKKSLGINGPVIVYMGRLSYEKSLDLVLKAFGEVLKSVPKATLSIVGDGPEKKHLQELSRDLGLENEVRFTGYRRGQELINELRASDVFVTASKTENMPISILEAMASGLPVVASASKGIPEIVRDNVTGFLVGEDSPEELAKKTIELLRDDSLRERFSLSARHHAVNYFHKRIASDLVEFYLFACRPKVKP